MNKDDIHNHVLLYAIGLAFIEIRSSESIKKARIISDVFHNAPAKMSKGFDPLEIEKEIIEKAEDHGVRRQIESMLDHAKKRFNLI